MAPHSHGPDLAPVIDATPRPLPAGAWKAGLALTMVGFAGVVVGLFTQTDRTLAAFLFNFLYFAGIAQGGFMLAPVSSITKARWSRPLKRVAEAFALAMPIYYLMLLVFLLSGGLHLYWWYEATELTPHKEIWLNPSFFVAREAVGLGLLIVLSLLYVRASLRADLGVAAARLGDQAPAWWARFIADWKGEHEEVQAAEDKMARLSPPLAIAFFFMWSIMVVDLSMSLSHWYANMFPAWYTASCFWSGLVFLGIVSLLARNWLGIGGLLTGAVYHDLGKLTFGFCMFWAYTLFAQYLAIWYGNMTEEIGFVLLRTHVEPWASVSRAVILLCFLVPFALLLNRSLKKVPSAYLGVMGIIALGLWLERYLVVVPSVSDAKSLPMGVPEISMALLMLGIFVTVVTWFLSKVPPVPVSDPYMMPHPEAIEVHPSGEAYASGSK